MEGSNKQENGAKISSLRKGWDGEGNKRDREHRRKVAQGGDESAESDVHTTSTGTCPTRSQKPQKKNPE